MGRKTVKKTKCEHTTWTLFGDGEGNDLYLGRLDKQVQIEVVNGSSTMERVAFIVLNDTQRKALLKALK